MPMRNPALLAAELSGRPLLMREDAVLPYAQALGLAVGDERRSPVADFFGRARRLFAQREDASEQLEAPILSLPLWMGEPDDCGFGWVLKDGIGVIEISGPLMAEGFGWGTTWYHGYDTLNAAYEEMFADARVRGVFSIWRTNGGIADAGLAEWSRTIRAGREAAGGKPCWAYCKSSYSAGYWGTAQHDWIVAAREGGVGSIGAVITHCEVSEGLKTDGITVTKFKFGKKKTDGAFDEPLSETASADFDADVQQCGRWFVADVMAGRPSLTEEAIIATEAGCFYGDSDDPAMSALKQGLIDAVMSERAAFQALVAKVATPVSPQVSPNPGQAAASDKEIDMKRHEVEAAMKAAGCSEAQIKAALAKLTAEGGQDENTDPEVDGEGGGEGDEGDEGEEGGDAKANATVAEAVLDLPEAKGREKLARKLAFTPGMTVKQAKDLLSASPKGETLADRMRGRDPNLSAEGGQVAPALAARLDPAKIFARRAASAKKNATGRYSAAG